MRNTDTDMIHFGSDEMFAMAWGVEPHPQGALGCGPVSSAKVFSDPDHFLSRGVAALVAHGGRTAVWPEVAEIAPPDHVLGVIEGRCRADRVFLEGGKAIPTPKRVGDFDHVRCSSFKDIQRPCRGCSGAGSLAHGSGSRRTWDRFRPPSTGALFGKG
jgi:hypothetical protein